MTFIYLALILAAGAVLGPLLTAKPRTSTAERKVRTQQVVDMILARHELAFLLVGTTEPGVSRLGGEPDMDPDAEWPLGPEGSLGFLGQIDLAEVRQADALEWLPATGLLQFFHD